MLMPASMQQGCSYIVPDFNACRDKSPREDAPGRERLERQATALSGGPGELDAMPSLDGSPAAGMRGGCRCRSASADPCSLLQNGAAPKRQACGLRTAVPEDLGIGEREKMGEMLPRAARGKVSPISVPFLRKPRWQGPLDARRRRQDAWRQRGQSRRPVPRPVTADQPSDRRQSPWPRGRASPARCELPEAEDEDS